MVFVANANPCHDAGLTSLARSWLRWLHEPLRLTRATIFWANCNNCTLKSPLAQWRKLTISCFVMGYGQFLARPTCPHPSIFSLFRAFVPVDGVTTMAGTPAWKRFSATYGIGARETFTLAQFLSGWLHVDLLQLRYVFFVSACDVC